MSYQKKLFTERKHMKSEKKRTMEGKIREKRKKWIM